MAKFSLKTHEERTDSRGHSYQVAVAPYARIASRDGIYFLQNGKFFTEGGQEVKDVPGWVITQADKLSEEVKREVGWGVQNLNAADAPKKAKTEPEEKSPAADKSEKKAPLKVTLNTKDDAKKE